ncbi:S1 family peptidase [Actinophytocola oryzae]|uniref:Streptogrisin C n=1 Tax=Actinophytocola oryzae TaxID=502181 RepID=A0A4R7UVD1_9PSEU|nr:S1 family peptidase [Actinophytocola oryzae]TDV38630.1 streptogrisin C [Actinophytocola oryzae]
MRRLFTTLVAVAACLVGLPAGASAAVQDPLGSGTVLFNPQAPTNRSCTAAFAATDGNKGFLIAGPTCTSGTLYATKPGGGMALVGNVTTTSPYNGYAVVTVSNTADWVLVPYVLAGSTKIVITGSKETPVGGKVCHVGPTVGSRCGSVDATNQTVTFPWGTATGVTRTSICSGSRDLGAAYLTDDQAQGVPLGGPDFCTTAGVSYFLPVNPILDKFGLKLVTG